ncbi:MAG: hypothetical protein QNJ01_15080 [Desulfobacterales bacterium]|nr:hypothetical protein [Desulfobacterales bacterium]
MVALLVIIAFTFTVSCTTKNVHPFHTTTPQQKIEGIKIGDTVKVTTYSGEGYKFKVERISEEEIEGEGIKLDLADIASIEKVYITGKRVAAAIGIITLLVLMVWLGSNSETEGAGRYSDDGSGK